MNTLFQNILTASFHGSIVILAVMLLRLVLKKTPRKYICLLWLLAGLRLLMPFQIQSDLSLQPSADPVAQVQQQISRSQTSAAPEDFSPADVEAPAQMPEALPDIQSPVTTVISSTPSPAPETAAEPDTGFDFLSVLPWFWLGIACCFGIYSLYTYLTLKLKVREAVKIPGGWECDRIETAFILGFIRPNIYIPMGMTPRSSATSSPTSAPIWTRATTGSRWLAFWRWRSTGSIRWCGQPTSCCARTSRSPATSGWCSSWSWTSGKPTPPPC